MIASTCQRPQIFDRDDVGTQCLRDLLLEPRKGFGFNGSSHRQRTDVKHVSNPGHLSTDLSLAEGQRKTKGAPGENNDCHHCLPLFQRATKHNARVVYINAEKRKVLLVQTLGESSKQRTHTPPTERRRACTLCLYLEYKESATKFDDKEATFSRVQRHNKERFRKIKHHVLHFSGSGFKLRNAQQRHGVRNHVCGTRQNDTLGFARSRRYSRLFRIDYYAIGGAFAFNGAHLRDYNASSCKFLGLFNSVKRCNTATVH